MPGGEMRDNAWPCVHYQEVMDGAEATDLICTQIQKVTLYFHEIIILFFFFFYNAINSRGLEKKIYETLSVVLRSGTLFTNKYNQSRTTTRQPC